MTSPPRKDCRSISPPSLAAAVNLANGFCRRLGIGRRIAQKSMDLTEQPGALALGLAPEELEKLLGEVKEAWFKKNDH